MGISKLYWNNIVFSPAGWASTYSFSTLEEPKKSPFPWLRWPFWTATTIWHCVNRAKSQYSSKAFTPKHWGEGAKAAGFMIARIFTWGRFMELPSSLSDDSSSSGCLGNDAGEGGGEKVFWRNTSSNPGAAEQRTVPKEGPRMMVEHTTER